MHIYTLPVQGAHEDHGQHAGQEEDDHEGVEDREPVDLCILHLEVRVPTQGPTHVRGLERDIVREDDLALLSGVGVLCVVEVGSRRHLVW